MIVSNENRPRTRGTANQNASSYQNKIDQSRSSHNSFFDQWTLKNFVVSFSNTFPSQKVELEG